MTPMDAYLRDTGVEMETYSRNGARVQTRESEALVRALLLAYIAAGGYKPAERTIIIKKKNRIDGT